MVVWRPSLYYGARCPAFGSSYVLALGGWPNARPRFLQLFYEGNNFFRPHPPVSTVYSFIIMGLAPRLCVRQVNVLCQAAGLLVQVKTQQFKKEIRAKKEGGKSKPKRGLKDKKALKQA